MGQALRALPQQNAWLLLGKQMTSPNRKRPTLSGYQAFTQVNGVRLSCGMPLLLAASPKPDLPADLPPTQVTATLTGNIFSLSLTCGSYNGGVQVWAAPPVLVGHDIYHPSAFKLLGKAQMEAGTPYDLTVTYLEQFKNVLAGDKIALTLYAVSGTGFRGPGLVAASVALGVGAEGD